jgi:hypothetical protein
VLTLEIVLSEKFNDETNEFESAETYYLQLEHSLVSLSKWEAKFKKPFLSRNERTAEESEFYIRHCMVSGKNPPEEIFQKLSQKNFDEIQSYINDDRSATTFRDQPGGGPRQIITRAVIYGWMVHHRIPFETEHWHLKDLFDLIRVCNEQSKPPKKMGRGEAARQQAQLNAQRRAQMGTGG